MQSFTSWYYSQYLNNYINGGELSIKIPSEVSTGKDIRHKLCRQYCSCYVIMMTYKVSSN